VPRQQNRDAARPAAPGVVGHVIVHLWRNMRPPFTLPSGQYQGEGDMQGRMTK
jgi:hypothetical protein